MNISNKKLKIIQVVFSVLSLLMIGVAYFRLLPKNICLFAMFVFFIVSIVVDFILKDRKIKEYSGKRDARSKLKLFVVKSDNLWFLFGVFLLIIVLLLRAIS